MTIMQKISLWMAKRYLRVAHCRINGRIKERLLFNGDMLLSPEACKIFNALAEEPDNEYSITTIGDDSKDFKGIKSHSGYLMTQKGLSIGTIVILEE